MKKKFEVDFLEEAIDFIESLEEKSREKILYNVRKVQIINDPELLRKLNGHLWEFRTRYNKKQYRLLAFWDKVDDGKTLVIATHGFIKKANRTPRREIKRAEEIRRDYFEHKSKKK